MQTDTQTDTQMDAIENITSSADVGGNDYCTEAVPLNVINDQALIPLLILMSFQRVGL